MLKLVKELTKPYDLPKPLVDFKHDGTLVHMIEMSGTRGWRIQWRSLEAVECATLEWVDWFNHWRLLEPANDVM